jgi:hypothetical protein
MMRRRGRIFIGAALAALGLLGVVGLLLTNDTRKVSMPSIDVATRTVTSEQLTAARKIRVFLGHMSVGENILSGTKTLYQALDAAPPSVVQFTVGGPLPDVPDRGGIVHALIGENGDPLGKLRNFDTVLRSGLAEEIDVAVLKFCYVDINHATEVDSLFQQYRSTLDALKRDYPDITFLHATVPLTVKQSGVKGTIKSLIGRDDNVARERYNALMREAYGLDLLFDIAALEATAPDGSRTPALYDGYTTDGGHLNETGSAMVAAGLLRLLSTVDVS